MGNGIGMAWLIFGVAGGALALAMLWVAVRFPPKKGD